MWIKMEEEMEATTRDERIVPCAIWTNDCQGKKSFDGPLLSISTRYWPGPGGGGAMTVNNTSEGVSFGVAPYGRRPRAHSSILLNVGPITEDDKEGDWITWREAEFEADTEEEVKARVEAWIKQQMDDLIGILRITVPKRQPFYLYEGKD
jgi:hypothetical protein